MDNQPPAPNNKKKLIIIIVSAVVVIGLGIGTYFLFVRPASTPVTPTDDTTDTTETEIPKASSQKSETERLKDYDDEIAAAGNDADRLNLILDNVMVMVELGHTGDALTRLQSIDTTGLSDFDLYRVYSHFAYVYDNANDTAAARSYHDLANAAYDRYEANGGGQ